MTDAEPAPSDGVEEQSVAAPPHVSTTRGPLTVEYCPSQCRPLLYVYVSLVNLLRAAVLTGGSLPPSSAVRLSLLRRADCSMPPEYCEFSACFADKCRPWLEKHHPELLSQSLHSRRTRHRPAIRRSLLTRSAARVAVLSPGGVDLSAAVAQLALTDHKDDAKDPKNGPAADDKKAAKKKPKGPSTDSASDSGSSSGSDEESAPSKPRGSAAAAIRTKAPVSSGVLIRKEERTKRKFTTSVKGLDGFGLDLKKAAKAFSKKFACSASVVKVSEGGHEIQIQGDVQMELPDFIVHEFNQVPPAALFFLDKGTGAAPYIPIPERVVCSSSPHVALTSPLCVFCAAANKKTKCF